MRRAVWTLFLGFLGAAVGVATAHAGGVVTTTTTETTTTTTGTTMTTTSPAYAPLAASSLPAGCVGAGAAAVVQLGRPVVALGTPASDLGPSGYPASGSVVAFSSSTASGSTCKQERVTLTSVSLFGGVVTASSVEATGGRGTVAGLAIDGSAASAASGQTLPVEGWGRLTLGAKVGRVSAPLVLRLLQAHDGLAAGTAIALAFSAAPQAVATPKTNPTAITHHGRKTPTSRQHAKGSSATKKHRRQPAKPPPDFRVTIYPFQADGGGLAPGLRRNPVVSRAMQYLGVPYQWGGASPATGFDCSGLVKYVFAHLGVSLVHYAASQWDYPDSVWVAPERLQPGDLVFFTGSDGTRKSPGHVGIYVDDGYFIDAPHTGSFVRIDRLNEPKFADEYVGARRIVSRLRVVHHVRDETGPGPAATGIPRGFASPFTIGAPAPSAIGTAGTAVHGTASPDYWVWVVIGALLIFLFA